MMARPGQSEINLEEKMDIKLVSSVLFVKDIAVSRTFYEKMLDQKVIMDHGPNVGFESGFAIWQAEHAGQIIFGDHGNPHAGVEAARSELYFETTALDEAFQRLQAAGVDFIHPMVEQPWLQRVFRFYDPDRHIIELGEPMGVVIKRLRSQGLSDEEIAKRTFMPLEAVKFLGA